MGDIPEKINLADPSVEPTDAQLRHIGQLLKDGIRSLPEGATLPPAQPTPPGVWDENMRKAMEGARKAYGKITGSHTGDSSGA